LELARNDWNIKPEWLERMPGLIGKSDPDYPFRFCGYFFVFIVMENLLGHSYL